VIEGVGSEIKGGSNAPLPTMNQKEFETKIEELMKVVNKTLKGKGVEYQTNKDVFSNFITLGEQLDLTEYQVWSVYFSKHIFSIQNAIKNFPNNPDNNLAEPLDSRITDAVAYLFLLYGMSKRNKQPIDNN
jgi:hypothetical protein